MEIEVTNLRASDDEAEVERKSASYGLHKSYESPRSRSRAS